MKEHFLKQKRFRGTLRMSLIMVIVGYLAFGIGIITAVQAEDFIVYPSKGQSSEQIEQDKFTCYSWAKQTTGFDPMAAPQATAPPPQKQAPKGGVLRGAAAGAVTGAIIGEIADDDAGKGAAIGAASGALFGGLRRSSQRRRQQQAQDKWAQQQADNYAQQRGKYNRAYAACLEGKGYVVK